MWLPEQNCIWSAMGEPEEKDRPLSYPHPWCLSQQDSRTRSFHWTSDGSWSLRQGSGQNETDANQLVQEKSSEVYCLM